MKSEETRYNKIKRRIENHPIMAVLLFLGVIIIGAGALTDSLDKILYFSQKHLSSTDIANKSNLDDQGHSVQNKSEPIITIPDADPIEKQSIIPPKVITANEKLPDENDPSSLISGTRLLTVLEPAFTKDRLSIINELAPKLAVLSSYELQEVLELLFTADRVDGLQVLLPHISKPLTVKEVDTILTLFFSKDVPKAVSLLTNSN